MRVAVHNANHPPELAPHDDGYLAAQKGYMLHRSAAHRWQAGEDLGPHATGNAAGTGAA